ncbi:MAG: hypothetical protein ACYCST_07190 [Acidimicrobiales bacterium]
MRVVDEVCPILASLGVHTLMCCGVLVPIPEEVEARKQYERHITEINAVLAFNESAVAGKDPAALTECAKPGEVDSPCGTTYDTDVGHHCFSCAEIVNE